MPPALSRRRPQPRPRGRGSPPPALRPRSPRRRNPVAALGGAAIAAGLCAALVAAARGAPLPAEDRLAARDLPRRGVPIGPLGPGQATCAAAPLGETRTHPFVIPGDEPPGEVPPPGRDPGSGDLPFRMGERHDLPGASYSIAAGDFDSDGRADLAAAVPAAGVIRVWTRAPSGGLTASDLPAPAAFWVAAADLDGDGHADLAVALNASPGAVLVFHGRGDGTFREPERHAAGRYPVHVAAGDLDGDGRPDLAVANYGDDTITLLASRPGGFAPGVAHASGPGPSGIAIADLDGDGWSDLAVAHSGCPTLGVHRNLGGGILAERVDYPTVGPTVAVAAGDLDGDGWTDLAASTYAGVAQILWSEGGAFALRDDLPVRGRNSFSIALADLDGDGSPDLAVTGSATFNGNWVTLLRNRAARTFDGSLAYFPHARELGGGAVFVTAADVAGTRGPDLVIADASHHLGEPTGRMIVLPHLGGAAFTGLADHALAPGPTLVQAVDFARSGRHDVLARQGERAWLMRSDAHGTLSPPADFPEGRGATALDLDRDGRSDLVASTGDSLVVRLTTADGRPGAPASYGAGALVGHGDFSGDGMPDLLVRGLDGRLAILFNDGAGRFGAQAPVRPAAAPAGSAPAAPLAVGDLDGDGLDDLVVGVPAPGFHSTTDPDSVAVLLNRRDGGFATSGTYPVARADGPGSAPRLSGLRVADLDGDRLADVVAVGSADGPTLVSVLRGRGGGALGPPAGMVMRGEDGAVHVADVDGDGRPDLIGLSRSDLGVGRLWIARNRGGGAFDTTAAPLETQAYPSGLAIGDLNGDGSVDLVLGYAGLETEGGVAALLNLGSGARAAATVSVAETGLRAGRARIVWRGVGHAGGVAPLFRRTAAGPWAMRATVARDEGGRFVYEDPAVRPGETYVYRLRLAAGRYSEEARITAPAAAFGLLAARPNPTVGDVAVAFVLADDGAARLELIDAGGRRIRAERIEAPGPGIHHRVLARGPDVPPGIYWVRLAQGSRSAAARVVVVR